jgi:hypothetical protein
LVSVAAVDYERILADEGLAPIDRQVPHQPEVRIARRRESGGPERGKAVDQWLEWAREVLRTHDFDTPWQRQVWQQYAQGRRLAEIAIKLRASKRAVTRALERVERWAPPPPVENPWRKAAAPDVDREHDVRSLLLRTDRRTTVRICMLALGCADKDRLREVFGADEQLSRLVPQEDPMEPKRAVVKHTYTKIRLTRTLDIPSPAKGARSRDELLNVDGRPHAGGIDVDIDCKDASGHVFTNVITVPWAGIRSAERAAAE